MIVENLTVMLSFEDVRETLEALVEEKLKEDPGLATIVFERVTMTGSDCDEYEFVVEVV